MAGWVNFWVPPKKPACKWGYILSYGGPYKNLINGRENEKMGWFSWGVNFFLTILKRGKNFFGNQKKLGEFFGGCWWITLVG